MDYVTDCSVKEVYNVKKRENGANYSNSNHYNSSNHYNTRRNGNRNGYNEYSNSNSNTNQFGQNGHDYVQIGETINTNTCTLLLPEIHALLAKRLEYKLIRQFDKADAIQTQLYEAGVRVHDKMRQWRADGGIFADVEGMLSNAPYTMNEYSESIPEDIISTTESTSTSTSMSTSNSTIYIHSDNHKTRN